MSEPTPEPGDQHDEHECNHDHGDHELVAAVIPHCRCGDPSCLINMLHNFKMRAIRDDEGEHFLNKSDVLTMLAVFGQVAARVHAGQLKQHPLLVNSNFRFFEEVLQNFAAHLLEPDALRDPVTAADVPDHVPDFGSLG